MVHGFPESWYSYRNQIEAIAGSGYTAAAIHVRGYGDSDKPEAISAYTGRENAADIAAVIDAIDPSGAVLGGHDWGSVLVQNTALIYPEKVKAMITLSVGVFDAFPAPPREIMDAFYPDELFFHKHFHTPGVAEAEIEPDIRKFLRMFFFWLSGDRPEEGSILVRPAGFTGLMQDLDDPGTLPDWLSSEEFEFYVQAFERGRFTGPLNRYRAFLLDYEELQEYANDRITAPSLFIAGDLDASRFVFGSDMYENPLGRCDDPRGEHLIPGEGHWIQQEAPELVNRYILEFLRELDLN